MFGALSQILASCFAATVSSTVLTPRGRFPSPGFWDDTFVKQRVLPSETAIGKMALMSAEQLSLKDRGRIAQGYTCGLGFVRPCNCQGSGTTPGVAISGAVTPTVTFRAFDPDTKKWVLLASLSGCIMSASFLGTGNNFSCVVFRKEKNREFPGSSSLKAY